MSDRSSEELAEQLRAGVAVLTAAHQLRTRQICQDEYARVVAEVAADVFAEQPVQLVLPVSWLALKLAGLVGELTGNDTATVLAWLGAEAAGAPTV
ncbi:hypothetical protein ACNF49_38345 [Actinomadura sp. ATCC 39365]